MQKLQRYSYIDCNLYVVFDENDIYDNINYQNDFARSDTVSNFGPPT